jgi:antitoxin FitA
VERTRSSTPLRRLAGTGSVHLALESFQEVDHGENFGLTDVLRRNHNGSISVQTMPTTLTLKGIPDDLYRRLKQTAEVHRRSLNNEAISVLETALLPRKATSSERISRARALRATLVEERFSAKEIDTYKRQGRR